MSAHRSRYRTAGQLFALAALLSALSSAQLVVGPLPLPRPAVIWAPCSPEQQIAMTYLSDINAAPCPPRTTWRTP